MVFENHQVDRKILILKMDDFKHMFHAGKSDAAKIIHSDNKYNSL